MYLFYLAFSGNAELFRILIKTLPLLLKGESRAHRTLLLQQLQQPDRDSCSAECTFLAARINQEAITIKDN